MKQQNRYDAQNTLWKAALNLTSSCNFNTMSTLRINAYNNRYIIATTFV
jgi:hypothetical protein